MTTLNNITAMRTRAWPLLFARLMLRAFTIMAPAMSLWLAARRLSGAFAPLPGVVLVLIGVIAACAAVLWRLAWKATESESAWKQPIARFLPPTCLALVVVALSMRGTPPLALFLFWVTVIAEEVWQGRTHATAITPAVAPQTSTILPEPAEADEEENSPLLPAGVSQQTIRSADGAGETLDCLLRIAFAAGEQTQAAHVAFCPPLIETPTTTVEYLEGAPCDAKVTSAEVFGARLEVKRRGPLSLADEAIVRLHVVCSSSGSG